MSLELKKCFDDDIFKNLGMIEDGDVPIINSASVFADKKNTRPVPIDPILISKEYRNQAYTKFKNKRETNKTFKSVKNFPKKINGNKRDNSGKFVNKIRFITVAEHERLYDHDGNKKPDVEIKQEVIEIKKEKEINIIESKDNIKKRVRFDLPNDYKPRVRIKFTL